MAPIRNGLKNIVQASFRKFMIINFLWGKFVGTKFVDTFVSYSHFYLNFCIFLPTFYSQDG